MTPVRLNLYLSACLTGKSPSPALGLVRRGAFCPEGQKQLDFFAAICKNDNGGVRCFRAGSAV